MRRPNYRQERQDRARKQAQKTAEKVAARAERAAKATQSPDDLSVTPDAADSSADKTGTSY